MSDSFITQCPHCGTSFRVRSEQLAVANGSVRCGACLQVFGARNHVLDVSADNATTKKVEAVKSKSMGTTEPNQAFLNKIKSLDPKIDEQIDQEDDDDEEFLFVDDEDDDILFEDNPEEDELDDNDGLGELSDSFINLNKTVTDPSADNLFGLDSQGFELTDDDDEEPDESWAESILEELEREESTQSKATPQAIPPTAPAFEPPNRSPKDIESILAQLDDEEDEPVTRSLDKVKHDFDIDLAPRNRFEWLRPLGWVFIVLLTVSFLAQLAWLERDKYARMDQWRGFYQSACDLIGCQLPSQVDLASIRTNVIVREHKNSEFNDIRIVDIVLTNRAVFKQRFPTLLLQYSDINGQLVADQAFEPDEYLKGEMTGVDLMPTNTRIYVSLPIRTPPARAINYQLLLSEPR